MAFETFLKIDGIDGESSAAEHEKWIEVLAFSWGASQPSFTSASGQGAVGLLQGPGSATFDTFSILKSIDKASPELSYRLCNGQAINMIRLSVYRIDPASSGWEVLGLAFENCLISHYQVSGGSEAPNEEISFAYAKVTMDEQSTLAASKTEMQWDLASNRGTAPSG